MANLLYSGWHRSLGYSYFAMDLDSIEIREGAPVALIEGSLCTTAYPECDGQRGVLSRFLGETGGFQFEMAYWVAHWLNVPAFVMCMNPLQTSMVQSDIHILSLSNGETMRTNLAGYVQFIQNLPALPSPLQVPPLSLPDLLEKLQRSFEGIGNYPYFSRLKRARWLEDYELRLQEIANRQGRHPSRINTPKNFGNFRVKGETTGQRPEDYEIIRQRIDRPYFHLDWVEWRKDNLSQTIGRPAALIKTVVVEEPCDFEVVAEAHYRNFVASSESHWWSNVASQMLVRWYFVVYSLTPQSYMGQRLSVWRDDGRGHIFDQKNYAAWIMSL
jgi:hypothetical protein